MDPAFWLQLGVTALISAIGVYYQRRQVQLMMPAQKPHQRIARYWPIGLMIALSASSWIPYILRPDDLPEWSDARPFIGEYGQDALQKICHVSVDGDRFWKYRDRFKLAAACYIDDGIGDPFDAPQVQTSRLYDIRKGSILMITVWARAFRPILR